MLGSVLHYVRHYPGRAANALTNDPRALIETLRDRAVQKREYRRAPCHYAATPDWEARLHSWMGAKFPCDRASDFHDLWQDAVDEVSGHGIEVGPESFAGFNDGDRGLVRAIWCLVRHLKPAEIVETGVAHGFTSRFILEAVARNNRGFLSSIDRPPLDPTTRSRIGIAVPQHRRDRWTLILNSSRRALSPLLARLGGIDLFIHDSLHTEDNLRFEMENAWAALGPGGAMAIDDIDTNWGFHSFAQQHPGALMMVCEAEPVRPDHRRFNGKGLFGLVLKPR